MSSTSNKAGRNKKKYLYFLIMACLLVFFAAIYMAIRLKSQEGDFELINKSGRIRMLSQSLIKTTYSNEKNRKELQDSLVFELSSSLNELNEFSQLSRSIPDQIKQSYQIQKLNLTNLITVISSGDKKEIKIADKRFLDQMEHIVTLHQRFSERNFRRMKVEVFILASSIMVILIINFIRHILPLLRKLDERNAELEKINEDLSVKEKELENLIEQNKIFIKTAPSAIAMFDKDMKYLAYSNKWLEDYQISEKEILGKSHYEIFPEIGEDWKKIHRECLKGAINVCKESLFIRNDGTRQWISWDVRPWYDKDGEIGGIIMNTNDLTSLKESIQDRLRLEEILSNTNEIARIGSWEVDLLKGKLFWDEITKEIHEVPESYSPILTEAINFYKEGKSREMISSAVDNAIKLGKGWDLELELITEKGKNVWARAIGQVELLNDKPVRLFGVFQDITDIKTYQNSLREINEELDAILNSSQVSIISTNQNGTIRHFNKGAELLLGYRAKEVIGNLSPEAFHEDLDKKQRAQIIQEKFGIESSGFDVLTEFVKRGQQDINERTYKRKDGSIFTVQQAVTPILSKNQDLFGYLFVAIDITLLKESQKKSDSLLQISNEQNSRLKNFAHIVSHNLRSHSTNISMILELLNDEEPEYAQLEMVQLLKEASQNLSETIQHLNEVVAINTSIENSLIKISLFPIVKNLFQSVYVLAKVNGVELINNVPTNTEILGIPAYMDSIVLNFITNAIKYRSPDRESYVQLSIEESKEYIILKVEDNGLGIDLKSYGSKLFGMYKTFHSHSDSRGIGLFITKNQVESMGGKIEVESEVNKGTTFKIYFKIKED